MKGKKKYLALVIFLFVGMLTYTFANQKEELGYATRPYEETIRDQKQN